jgi:DNA-binding NarL/FixJ family response regulator
VRVALIERGTPWRLIAQVFGGARAGVGSVLLIEGPNGIGKSALLNATGALARETGMRVLTARAHARERNFRFGVIVQLLDGELGDRRPGGSGTPTFDELHSLLGRCRKLAETAGLVLVVDDADLADDASLHFLRYLTERVHTLPIAVVMAAGTVGPAGAPLLMREIARHGHTTRCRLAPLSLHGTRRRVAKSWPAVSDEGAREIHRVSGGRPFLVTALANAVAASGAPDRPELAGDLAVLAADQIADWALACARDIDERAPAVLDALSLVDGGCSARHLGALTGLGLATVVKLLDRLADAALVSLGEEVAFAQPAVASAIRQSQPPGTRAFGILKVAELFAEEDPPPERLAELLMNASRTASDWVVDTLCVAATLAFGRGAPHDAVRYLRRALEEPPKRESRPEIVLQLGRAEAAAGEPQAAARLTDAVAGVADTLDDPVHALEAGRALFALGRPREALTAFDTGLRRVSGDDPDLAGRLEAGRETAVWLAGLADGNSGPVRPAPASADAPGDRVLLALHALQSALRGEPREEVQDAAARALARGALLKEETSDGVSYYLAAMALAFTEDLQSAEAALTAAIDDAQTRGSVLGFATASHIRAMTILLRGRLRDAATDARYALAVERHGWRLGLGGARVVLARVCIEQGDLVGAATHLDAAEALDDHDDPFRLLIHATRGRVYLLSGDAEAALECLYATGAIADGAGILNPAVAPWRSDAGLATALIGDRDEAERLIRAELSHARTCGAPGAIGRAMRALASIHPPADALEVLKSAVETLSGSQAALERAHALVDYGAALRRAGQRRKALGPIREGLDLAERCGADQLVNSARREAQAAGARPRRAAIHGEDALTTREEQVAGLAAEGLSNRAIAEALVVTVKTVEWHLRHVFSKLGVRSRRELAGKLAQGESHSDSAK